MEIGISADLAVKVREEFNRRYDDNKKIHNLKRIIDSGKGTYVEAHEYAKEVGLLLSDVFGDMITADVLPDGMMFFELADAVVGERLRNNFALVCEFNDKIQETLNSKAGLKIRPIRPKINQSRINGILNRLDREPDFDKVKWILQAPVTNYTQSVVDSYIHANLDLHLDSGMKPKIRRIAVGGCCAWCRALEGVWLYSEIRDAGNPVFQRHENCDCMVLYDPMDGRGWMDTHTKTNYYQEQDVKEEVQKRIDNALSKYKRFENRMPEYAKSMTPGVGKIEIPKSMMRPKDQAREKKMAKLIKSYFGGDIKLLEENKIDKMADFLWNGKKWDLKTVSSVTATKSAVGSGIKQIKSNPGGVILDFGDREVSLKAVYKNLVEKLEKSGHFPFDIMIVSKGQPISIFRYTP